MLPVSCHFLISIKCETALARVLKIIHNDSAGISAIGIGKVNPFTKKTVILLFDVYTGYSLPYFTNDKLVDSSLINNITIRELNNTNNVNNAEISKILHRITILHAKNHPVIKISNTDLLGLAFVKDLEKYAGTSNSRSFTRSIDQKEKLEIDTTDQAIIAAIFQKMAEQWVNNSQYQEKLLVSPNIEEHALQKVRNYLQKTVDNLRAGKEVAIPIVQLIKDFNKLVVDQISLDMGELPVQAYLVEEKEVLIIGKDTNFSELSAEDLLSLIDSQQYDLTNPQRASLVNRALQEWSKRR